MRRTTVFAGLLWLALAVPAAALDFDQPLQTLPGPHEVAAYRWNASHNPLFHSFEVDPAVCALSDTPFLDLRIKPWLHRKAGEVKLYAVRSDASWLVEKTPEETGKNRFRIDLTDLPEGDYVFHLIYKVKQQRIHLQKDVALRVFCRTPPPSTMQPMPPYRFVPGEVLADHVTTLVIDFAAPQQAVKVVAFGEQGDMLEAASTPEPATSKGFPLVFEKPGRHTVYLFYGSGTGAVLSRGDVEVGIEEREGLHP